MSLRGQLVKYMLTTLSKTCFVKFFNETLTNDIIIFEQPALDHETYLLLFSLFSCLKKSSCQLLAKEYALDTGKLLGRVDP